MLERKLLQSAVVADAVNHSVYADIMLAESISGFHSLPKPPLPYTAKHMVHVRTHARQHLAATVSYSRARNLAKCICISMLPHQILDMALCCEE